MWFWNKARTVRAVREFLLDARRHVRLSSPGGEINYARLRGKNLEGQLTRDYHRIEKALSLNEPRRPFGLELEKQLATLVGADGAATQSPLLLKNVNDSVTALRLWNDEGKIDDSISPVWDGAPTEKKAGLDGSALFERRRSVRNFDSDRSVDLRIIREAVRLAGLTPSVCNRQPWKAYCFTRDEDLLQILQLHAGSKGFGTDASGIIAVSVDLRLFSGAGERNQRWIDGGLFAMSLVLAFESLGVSTCMLNWSRDNSDTAKLRDVAGISNQEDVVVLIAFGYPRKGHRVARSPRRSVDELLILN